MDKSFLPSKKIWGLIGIVLIVALGLYLFTGGEDTPSSLVGQSNLEDAERVDSDNDGLEDWEETLWNTDINNPDTDGDGVSDGEEVDNGTHPKISGPNDAIDQRRVDAVYNQDAEVPDNKTTDAWEDLLPYMASYISVTGGDKEISDERLEEISEEIAQRAETEASDVKRYSREDLDIDTEVTFEDLDAYFADFTQTSAEYYSNTEMDNELLIFAQAAAGENVSEDILVGLEVVATDYRSLANELLEMTVPESLASLHLEVINNYLGLAQATENMATLQSDPVRSMVGLKKYRELMHIHEEVTSELGEQIGSNARLLLESE